MIKHLYHYWLIQRSGLFDRSYYRRTHADQLKPWTDPLWHFVTRGWREGCNPSPHFDTRFYLHENRDVRQAKINPLVHYIKWGRKEGRSPKAFKHLSYPNYQIWIKKYDILTKKDKLFIKSRINSFKQYPKLTLIMFIVKNSEKDVQTFITSIQDQLYKKWQLIIFSRKSKTELFSSNNITRINNDPRINFLISEETPVFASLLNDIVKCSSGNYIGFIKPSDILSQHALYLVAENLNEYPDSQILYSDEDRIDHNGNRCNPFFKPDWNPDLFLTKNYLSGLTFIRKTNINKTCNIRFNNPDIALWDLFQRTIDSVDSQNIQHIPFVLCHKKKREISGKLFNNPDNIQAYKRMILSHLQRVGENAEVVTQNEQPPRIIYHLPKPEPMVSIIIPIKDQHKLLSNCLGSIQKTSEYQNIEIIIVNNQSKDPETLKFLTLLSGKENLFRVIEYNQPFNFSAINNYGVKEAKGKIIIFLNNDIEAFTSGWIDEMAGHAIRPGIGAVGAMLYYPNDTIQHAGLTLNYQYIALHNYHKHQKGFAGHKGRARFTQNLSAVTGACLVVEKEKFQQVGGFDKSNLKIAYNDIDLCLSLQKAGYRNVWTPHVELYHHESASRGYEDTLEKKTRIELEAEFMRKKWGPILVDDPAYNPNLTLDLPNFSLAFPPRATKPWLEQLEKR